MTDKTWTATDLRMGGLHLNRSNDGSILSATQHYYFLDASDEPLPFLSGVVEFSMPIGDVPTDVLSALVTINNHMKDLALEQEEMN